MVVLILLGVVLYVASYVYSLRWFIRKNFLEDHQGETTLGSFVTYIVWSLFGPIICFGAFFVWFINLDCWLWNIRDINFRYLVTFIPVIGFIAILVKGLSVQRKLMNNEHVDLNDFWLNKVLINILMIWHCTWNSIVFLLLKELWTG